MTALDAALERWLDTHDQRLHDDLFAFLRIPSVSARSEHKDDVAAAAAWLHGHLARIGFTTETIATDGHPVVLAEWRKAPEGAPTVLVYGHYDVQPPEPLELWTSPAFEPTIRDGNIYARGSVDDKGQLWLHVAALEAHLATRGTLPVNVIVIAEGEEEVGSEHLAPFIEQHRGRLACDAVVISDSTMFAPGIPSILSSLRGLAYFQIDVTGPNSDLHSGMYGGAVVNPATALARIIASLHHADGRIAIPGFFDDVRPFPDHVRAGMRDLPFDETDFMRHLDVTALGGEPGYSTLEKLWTRPTCEVNGVLSGYTGEGAKTVLPGKAMAKVSCRLVPDQDPATIHQVFERHVQSVAPSGVSVTVTALHGGHPWRADLEGPLYDAAARALTAAFGRAPVVTGEGGSIPVVNDFARLLNAPVLLVGFGLPGENAHAPDEWISQDNFRRGMRAVAALWDELGSARI
ncbi:MAG: dipeptidase [Gemmatimonadaceae bacterium]